MIPRDLSIWKDWLGISVWTRKRLGIPHQPLSGTETHVCIFMPTVVILTNTGMCGQI
jgi:hypothetical protein